MAIRYLAIVSQASEDTTHSTPATQGARVAHILPYVQHAPGLTIRSNTPALSIAPGAGAVIGDLFTREHRPRHLDVLAERIGHRARETDGQSLIDDCWGGYVAFIAGAAGDLQVIRDPSAAMPCVYLKWREAYVFASDPDLLVDAGFLVPQIDFQFLRHHLFAPDVRTPATALDGLQELMPGFRVSLSGGQNQLSPVWSPWAFCRPDADATDATLAARLEEVALGCIGAWGRRYPSSLLGVSGGLDSSIVAAGLVTAKVPPTCVTIATDEAEGDERPFARILCQALALSLIEAFHRPEAVDFTRALSSHLPRPVGHAFGHSNYAIRFALEDQLGIDAFFSGVGGDNVFCFTQSATALVDRLRAHGLEPGLIDTLRDICRQNNASVGAVLRMAWKRYRNADPAYRVKGDAKFLGPAAQAGADDLPHHPWLAAPAGALPGKAAHVAMLLHGTIDGLPRDHAPQILPLISQPIMETCLRIPMWTWIAGGRNRSVARAAFSSRLPKALVDRQSKGGPNSFAYAALEQHKALVLDRLTQGRLAQEGLIDAKQLAEALDPRRLVNPADHMRISDLAECEAWIRHWEQR